MKTIIAVIMVLMFGVSCSKIKVGNCFQENGLIPTKFKITRVGNDNIAIVSDLWPIEMTLPKKGIEEELKMGIAYQISCSEMKK